MREVNTYIAKDVFFSYSIAMGEIKIKAILFDKDGTLFNYGEIWGSIIAQSLSTSMPLKKLSPEKRKQCLREFQIVIGVDESGHSYSDGILFRHDRLINATFRLLRLCFRYRLSPIKVYQATVGVAKRSDHGLKEKLDNIDFPDVRTVFEACHMRGYTLGMVTNDTNISTSMFLERMDAYKYISFIRTGESACRHKPNPQAIKQFCQENKISSEEVCVVGDTIIDMQFAKNGKVGYSVAVLTGSGDKGALSRLSNAVYPSLKDILSDPVLFPPIE